MIEKFIRGHFKFLPVVSNGQSLPPIFAFRYSIGWRLYILPQYIGDLTQPVATHKAIFFVITTSCMLSLKFLELTCAFL